MKRYERVSVWVIRVEASDVLSGSVEILYADDWESVNGETLID